MPRSFTAIAIILFLSACKMRSDGAINPQFNSGQGTSFWSEHVASEVCKKRKSCAADDPMCMSTLLANTQITSELRENPPYRTLSELNEAERVGAIVVDTEKFPHCLNSVINLACSEYQNYANIHLIFKSDIACTEAFKEKN